MPPVTFVSRPRSAEATLFVVSGMQVEKPGAFTAGIVSDPATGKVFHVTRCNQYVIACLVALGVKVALMSADDLFNWFQSDEAKTQGWEEVSAEDARQRAEIGFPVVAVWHSEPPDIHGHIVLMTPAPEDKTGVPFCSSAGSPQATFERGPVVAAFGSQRMAKVRYFAHS